MGYNHNGTDISAKIQLTGTKGNEENIWGFWDGTNIYVKIDTKYFPLSYEEGRYYVWMKAPTNHTYLTGWQAALAGSSFFAGGIWGYGSKVSSLVNIASFLSTSVKNNDVDKVKYYLTYNTAEFKIDNTLTQYRPIVRIYSAASNPHNTQIGVTIDSKRHAIVKEHSYYDWIVDTNADNKMAEITLQTSVNKQSIIIPVEYFALTVIVCKVNKKGELSIELANDKETEIINDFIHENSNSIIKVGKTE